MHFATLCYNTGHVNGVANLQKILLLTNQLVNSIPFLMSIILQIALLMDEDQTWDCLEENA